MKENNNIMSMIKDESIKKRIIERCGKYVVADGIRCTHCGCLETYKDGRDPENVEKWFFMIKAFRVDNSSECNNCGNWFDMGYFEETLKK